MEIERILAAVKEVLLEMKNNREWALKARLEVETKGKVRIGIWPSKGGLLMKVVCGNQYNNIRTMILLADCL